MTEPSEFHKRMIAYSVERHFDLMYLKLTVVIVLLIIIIFYITCKFNVGGAKSKALTGPVSVGISGAPERFTPSPSILKNDIYRSDPAFDATNGYAYR